MNHNAPKINNEFFVIVDREKREFAAVISSYLNRLGVYLPMFEFPFVSIPKPADRPEEINEDFASVDRAFDFDNHSHNALLKIRGCGTLILAGLTPEQRSYLSYLNDYPVVEIGTIQDVPAALGGFIPERDQTLPCKPDQVLIGLHVALQTGRRLLIDANAEDIVLPDEDKAGLIIIEDLPAVSSVVAVNYAACVDAKIKVVADMERGEERRIRQLIEKWQRNESAAARAELGDIIHLRLEGIWFPQYQYTTFFTSGIPYSIGMRNMIPCSYVHLMYGPDFFIFNNLFFEHRPPVASAIVFSTPEFVKYDETVKVCEALKAQSYYVRELIGKQATAYNLDMHIRDFAYGLLHISSHGGEIKGATIIREFRTEDGKVHRYEYDEIVTFCPVPGVDQIGVTSKWFPRKLNDDVFGSKEMAEKNYPDFVFEAINKLYMERDKDNIVSIQKKKSIPDSCSISCSDFDYQAGFDRVASAYYAPYVFNNSCWSWSSISWEFLYAGVRGYIGTLFAIGTPEATAGATEFYDNVFNEPIIESVCKANDVVRGTEYEDIYIYYGLHFATMKAGNSIAESKMHVAKMGIRSVHIWKDRIDALPDGLTKKRVEGLFKWNVEQLRVHLKPESEQAVAEAKAKMMERQKRS